MRPRFRTDVATSNDPWDALHARFAPMLLFEAQAIADDDPDYEPVGLVLGADAAEEALAEGLFEGGPHARPGCTASVTLPRSFVASVLEEMGKPVDQWLPAQPADGRRRLSIITMTHGRMRVRHEYYRP